MNAFKEAISARTTQIGIWQALASPYTAEICAGAGFDWLLFDAEHGPNDIPLVLSQLQAVAASSAEPVVRLPVADAVLVKQYLDIGARSLLVPMIETADTAEAMVRATRYPPFGNRGVGSAIGRASRWNRTPSYLHEAHKGICLLLQIESNAGLTQLESIAKIDGVDGIFIGPSDLAADLGHIGNPGHRDVQKAIEDALRRISNCGKPSGILIADETLAQRYIELGASFVAVGTDVTILSRGAETLAARFKHQLPMPSFIASDSSVY